MSRTSRRKLKTALRREFVLQARLAGLSYEQIAQKAVEHFGADDLPRGWSSRYAHQDVVRVLEKLNRVTSEAAEEIRRLELERLDSLLVALWVYAMQSDYQAVDRVLRIMERRAKLLGLDAPSRWQEIPFDLEEYGELSAEEILDEAKRILGIQ